MPVVTIEGANNLFTEKDKLPSIQISAPETIDTAMPPNQAIPIRIERISAKSAAVPREAEQPQRTKSQESPRTMQRRYSMVVERIANVFKLKGLLNKNFAPTLATQLRNRLRLKDFNHIDINHSIKRVKKYYKDQQPSTEDNFIDKLFPPDNNSIFSKTYTGMFIDPHKKRTDKYLRTFSINPDDVIWLRAKDIFEGVKYSLFMNDIGGDDIAQGQVGNCYLMSTLSALCANPQLIIQIFKILEISPNGCYEVGLNLEGEWQIVVLDDYFPCNKRTRQPLFARPKEAELWVLLLEKAWAKVNGGYLNITGGWATEVLSVFTSFPIEYFSHIKYEKSIIWRKLTEATKKGYIMACCSKPDIDLEQVGLVPGHDFTLVACKEGIVSRENVRLVRLRNPWGYREWTGKWSDNSTSWTPEAKKVFGEIENKDDGLFWMDFEDYIKYFVVTEICKVSSPHCTRSFVMSGQDLDYANVYELKLTQDSEVSICAIKQNYRFHRKIPPEVELTVNLIIISKTNTLTYHTSVSENDTNPHIELKLSTGSYLIYVHANEKYSTYDKRRDIRVRVSSNNYFSFREKGYDSHFTLLKTIMKTRINLTEGIFPELDDNDNEVIEVKKNSFEHTTYGFLYLVNKTKSAIRVTITDDTHNFEILASKNEFDQILEPKETMLLLGIRRNFYDKFWFRVMANIGTPTIKNKNSLPSQDPLTSFITDLPTLPFDQNDYDFIYKKCDVDLSRIVEAVNYIESSKEFFLKKYPDIMKRIFEISPLEDEVQVIFRDIFDYGDSVYLGEWRMDEELVRHGRGLFIWNDGSSYIGQIENNVFSGFGIFTFINRDRCEIQFKDGAMHGNGIYVKADGEVKSVTYENGKLI